MTSETPILVYPGFDHSWGTRPDHSDPPPIKVAPTWDTMVVGIDEERVSSLAAGFDAWAEADAATPVDPYLCRFNDPLCRLMAFHMGTPRLVSPIPDGVATQNPAADLRRWLSPEVSIPTIAAACGVSERGFYGWLRGGGMRERNARRLYQVRSIVQALGLRLGRRGAIEWLLCPEVALDLVAPLDVLVGGDQQRVLAFITGSLARPQVPPAGPMIAEDTAEDFSSFDLPTARPGAVRPRRRVGA